MLSGKAVWLFAFPFTIWIARDGSTGRACLARMPTVARHIGGNRVVRLVRRCGSGRILSCPNALRLAALCGRRLIGCATGLANDGEATA